MVELCLSTAIVHHCICIIALGAADLSKMRHQLRDVTEAFGDCRSLASGSASVPIPHPRLEHQWLSVKPQRFTWCPIRPAKTIAFLSCGYSSQRQVGCTVFVDKSMFGPNLIQACWLKFRFVRFVCASALLCWLLLAVYEFVRLTVNFLYFRHLFFLGMLVRGTRSRCFQHYCNP